MNSVFYRRECQSCKSKYHQLSARQDFTFFFTIFLLPSGSKTRFDLEACALQSHQFHNTSCEISVKIPLTWATQDRTSLPSERTFSEHFGTAEDGEDVNVLRRPAIDYHSWVDLRFSELIVIWICTVSSYNKLNLFW